MEYYKKRHCNCILTKYRNKKEKKAFSSKKNVKKKNSYHSSTVKLQSIHRFNMKN